MGRLCFNVDPEMLMAMAKIESGGNPLAIRYERLLGDVSIGLMQTLLFNGALAGPDSLWTLFGAGYLGYTGARSMDKRSKNDG